MSEFDRKTILLDLDGTLTYPFPGISACIAFALEEMNIAVPGQEDLRSWIGPPLLKSFDDHFNSLSVTADAERALSLYRQRFSDKGLFENEVYAGIPQVLSDLKKAGHQMFLATAKPHVYARRIVEHFGLNGFLQQSYGAELDGTRTDKVELIQYIIDEEGLDPQNCAMIGDRKHDMIGARYHGMQAIGVLWGYGSGEELLEAGAEVLLESPKELFTVFK
jgi:phosphoglycolate phosphatase